MGWGAKPQAGQPSRLNARRWESARGEIAQDRFVNWQQKLLLIVANKALVGSRIKQKFAPNRERWCRQQGRISHRGEVLA